MMVRLYEWFLCVPLSLLLCLSSAVTAWMPDSPVGLQSVPLNPTRTIYHHDPFRRNNNAFDDESQHRKHSFMMVDSKRNTFKMPLAASVQRDEENRSELLQLNGIDLVKSVCRKVGTFALIVGACWSFLSLPAAADEGSLFARRPDTFPWPRAMPAGRVMTNNHQRRRNNEVSDLSNDLNNVKEELRTDVITLKNDTLLFKDEISGFKKDVMSEFEELRNEIKEFKTELQVMRTEIDEFKRDVKSELNALIMLVDGRLPTPVLSGGTEAMTPAFPEAHNGNHHHDTRMFPGTAAVASTTPPPFADPTKHASASAAVPMPAPTTPSSSPSDESSDDDEPLVTSSSRIPFGTVVSVPSPTTEMPTSMSISEEDDEKDEDTSKLSKSADTEKDSDEDDEEDDEEKQEAPYAEYGVAPPYDDFITTISGLRYKILKPGTGVVPHGGQMINAHYTGWMNGFGIGGPTNKFDCSRDRKQPLAISVGGGQVLRGLDAAISQLSVGERRLIILPPHLAYGERGAGGIIPPGATLYFDVELIEILS